MNLNLVRRYLSPDPKEPSGKVEEEPKKETKPEEDNVSLAKALKETRENSVSKEEYEKLKAEPPSTLVKIAMEEIWFFTDGLNKNYGEVK